MDNRKSNLRICSSKENRWNAGSMGGSSKFKGVSWYKETRKWRAQIEVNGKTIHLGLFNDEVDAAKAYDESAIKIHGEFALLNVS